MVLACVVRNCDRKWCTRCPIIFHSFPKCPERRKLWLNLIELKSQFYECAKVCSKHFLESDYLNGKRLKIDACPSLYLARPSAPSTSSAIVQDAAPTSILQPIDSNIIAVRTSPRKRKYHQEILEPKARPSAPSTSSAIVQDAAPTSILQPILLLKFLIKALVLI